MKMVLDQLSQDMHLMCVDLEAKYGDILSVKVYILRQTCETGAATPSWVVRTQLDSVTLKLDPT